MSLNKLEVVSYEPLGKLPDLFRFEDGRGLLVEPYAQNTLSVDGVPYENRHNPLYMGHGSRLYVGEAVLRLRLFAGFEATGHAIRQSGVEDAPPEQQPDQAQMQQQIAYQQWMQQQWMMQQYAAQQQAYQQGYQQAMMQQQLQQPEPEEEEILFDDQADVYTYEAAREQGLVDDRAFMRPEGMQKPELPVYDEPAPQPQETFYAPVMDDGWDEQPPTEEDDLTDAAAPPKSAYVGHDEAERAKRQVWDKMFGGGQR